MLLCQNDRHRNPVSLIQYSEVVLVVGYIMLGTLAAFGLVSALWVLYGFLLPAERGGGLYAPARPGVTEDSFARRYLWLRELGLLREELTMVDFGISNAERDWLTERGVRICTPEKLAERMGERTT